MLEKSVIAKSVVKKGKQDKTKDFPTANVEFSCAKGIYLCETNYGYGLATCVNVNKVEIHIIGFDQNIYGKMLEIKSMREFDKKKLFEICVLINNV